MNALTNVIMSFIGKNLTDTGTISRRHNLTDNGTIRVGTLNSSETARRYWQLRTALRFTVL